MIKNFIFGLKIDKRYCLLAKKYKIVIYKNKIHSIEDSVISFDDLAFRMAQNYGFNKQETVNLCNHFYAEILIGGNILISPDRQDDYSAYWNNQLTFNELFLTQNFKG